MKHRSNIKRLLLTTSVSALAAGLATQAQAACVGISTLTNPTNTNQVCITLDNNSVSGNFTNSAGITIGVSPGITTAVVVGANTLGGTFINNGTIEGTKGAAKGIDISGTGLIKGGILNAGQILGNATGNGNHGIGILISAPVSPVSGGITNTGTIQGNGNATVAASAGTGIALTGATFNGGISNSNQILATGKTGAVGINLNVGSFNSGIHNSGTVAATAAAGIATGINITGGTFVGGVANSGNGAITANGSNQAYGIRVHSLGDFEGGIKSSGGLISAITAKGTAVGIDVQVGTFNGGISSNGSIHASVGAADASAFGIRIINTGAFNGGVTNSGGISAAVPTGTAAGIAVGQMGTFQGGITNSGAIGASATKSHVVGIAVGQMGTFQGGISNTSSGSISVSLKTGTAIGIGVGAMSLFSGGISSAGSISATATSGAAFGIRVGSMASFGGGITSSGSINVTGSPIAEGIVVANMGTFDGSIVNSGPGITVSATASGGTAVGIFAGAFANGAAPGSHSLSNFTGGITSSGGINVHVDSGFAVGISVVALASGSGNTATVSTGFQGGISNSGNLSASVNTGSAAGIIVGATSFSGGTAHFSSFTGNITNSGTILASAFTGGTAAGIVVVDITQFSGSIINSGSIGVSVGSGVAYGILVQAVSNFSGGITNSGAVNVSVDPGNAFGILVGATTSAVGNIGTFSGNIVNSAGGLIQVSSDSGNAVGIAVGGTQSDNHPFVGISLFSGSITNSGTINASASFGQAFGIFAGGVGGASSATTGILNFTGSIVNSSTGVINVSANSGNAVGIFVGGIGAGWEHSLTGIGTFSGGVTNAGLINAGATNGNAIGIAVGGLGAGTGSLVGVGSFGGDILNSGTIIVTTTALALAQPLQVLPGLSGNNAVGIFVGGIQGLAGSTGSFASNGVSKFTGSITNSGTIMATAQFGEAFGIFVGGVGVGFVGTTVYNFAGVSTFSGRIVNTSTGVITATSTGGDAVGIFVGALTGGEGPTGVSTFTGGITNEGTIFATANGGALDGIAIGIGVGQLHATIGGFLNGVETFSGGITNSGLIHASAQSGIAIGIMVGNPGFISESSIGYGGVSTFSGGILNTGTIIATATNQPESLIGANAFGILVNGAFFTGSGYFAGIQTFNDGISNSGVIQVSAHSSGYHQAAGIAAWFVSTFNGGIQNSGTITAISDGNGGAKADEAKAYGIYVYGISTFNGGISNSGTITALAPHGTNDSAVGIYVSGVPTFNGGIFNSGTIVAGGTSGVNAATYATGIDVNLVATFHGGISNSGVISATGGQFAGGIVVNVFSLFDGGITNSGSIFATSVDTGGFAEGIGIDPSVFIGNVYNSGLIKVEAVQTAVGVDVQASTFNGGIVNTETGIIHVIGGGEGGGAAYGIRLHNISVFVGGIENAGTISVENRYVGNTNIKAYGIYIDVSSFGGGITNSGLIKALTTSLDPVKVQGASGIGIFSTSAVVGTITNTGTIIGTNWAIDLSQSQGSNTINTSAGFIGGGINLSDTFTDFVNISGGTVEASIRGQAAVVNMTDGLLTVPIDRSFVQSDGVTRDFTQYKSVGTMVAPIATFTATGGTINFALDGTPADPLTGVGTNTLTGGGVEVRNGFIFARTTTVTNGVGFTVTPMPDLYLDGTIYHQVLNGQSQFSGPDTPALVSIVTPGGTVPSTLLMTFTLNPDDCMANLASCAGNLTGEGGADQINLSVRKFENPLGVGLTPNEIQAGRGLDALAHSPNGLLAFGTSQNLSLGGLFLITDPKTYQTALDQLGGYQIAQGFNLSMGIPIYTGESIQTLLAAGPNRGGMVQSARLTNSGIQIAAAGKIVTDADSPTQVAQGAAGPSAAPWTFWGRGYGVWGNADSQTSPNHVAGYNETRGGGIFGADYTFNENWLLGGVVNYSHSNMDFDQNLGNTDLDNFLLGIYGQYRSGPWYVNGTFQGGWDWYTTNRNIFVPIKATAHSSYNGSTYGIYGETGWDFLLNSWKLTPFVGFGWVHGHIDSFTESGAGPADLAVHDSSEDSIQSTLGGRISTRLPLWGSFIVPEVRAAWQHEFGDQAHTINNSFALSPSGVFTQQGTEFGRDAGVFGVSLTYEVRSDMKVFADFDYKTMSSYNAEAVMAGLKLSFGAPAPLPPKVAPAAQPAPPPPPTARLFIVYFDFNKSDLTADGQKVVDQAVATFKQTGSVQVKIDGYTDLAGTQAYNLGLSKKRADIVRAAMVKGGVPANSIVEAWHGKENPAVPTADGVREARNRRAEILLP